MFKALIAAAAVFLFLGTDAAFGQNLLEASVPFEFHAGKTLMPAGDYTIEQSSGFITLATQDRSAAVAVVSHGVSNRERAGQGLLIFKRYDDRHFFSELWHPQQRIGRAVTPTPYEREMARSAGVTQIASVSIDGTR